MPPVKSPPPIKVTSTPRIINAYEDPRELTTSTMNRKIKKQKKLFHGLSATIDRISYKSSKNNDYNTISEYRSSNKNDFYNNFVCDRNLDDYSGYSKKDFDTLSRSATVSRYYGVGITETEPKKKKSDKKIQQRNYYSTLRTIKGWFKLMILRLKGVRNALGFECKFRLKARSGFFGLLCFNLIILDGIVFVISVKASR